MSREMATRSGARSMLSPVSTYDTVADLRLATQALMGEVAHTRGHLTATDGGGGIWRWDSASTATDDGVLVTQLTGVTAGRFLRVYSGGIQVRWFATSGLGTYDSPWLGWDTAITWAAYTTYRFDDGWFGFTTSPAWAKTGIRLLGSAGTYLLHLQTTATRQNAVYFDGLDVNNGTSNVLMDNFTIDGGWNKAGYQRCANVGLRVRKCHNSLFSNIRVRNVRDEVSNTVAYGFLSEFCIYTRWDNPVCVYNASENTWWTDPQATDVLTGFAATDDGGLASTSSTPLLYNPVMQNMRLGNGIWLVKCDRGMIYGGSAENNHCGVLVDELCNGNMINGTWVESNTGPDDFLIKGRFTILKGIISRKNVHFWSSGAANYCYCNELHGGFQANITIDTYALKNVINRATCQAPTGTLTDNGRQTYIHAYHSEVNPALSNIEQIPAKIIQKSHEAFAGSSSVAETAAVQTTGAGGVLWEYTLPDTTVIWMEVEVAARETGGVDCAGWKWTALAHREGGASAIVNGTEYSHVYTAGATTWQIGFGFVGNVLKVTVTPAVATTINWVGTIRYQLVSGAT